MFGIVTASLSCVTDEEKARYQALYCGLCRTLKDRYGQVSRSVLTYDLTFYIMLCNSLHEPPEQTGAAHCVTHPVRKMPYARSIWSDYAADLAVALAYHKLLDDWHDEHSKKARAAQALLARAYKKAQDAIPAQCAAIEASIARTTAIERDPDARPDDAAKEFGSLLGELFAWNQGVWKDAMRQFGNELGRFIYLMDAAVDFADDAKTGSYNPFVQIGATPENMKTLLSVLIGNATATFEKLPLVQDLHLMRSVLYSGVWQKFNKTYEAGEAGSAQPEATPSAAQPDATPAAAQPSATLPEQAQAACPDASGSTRFEKEHHD